LHPKHKPNVLPFLNSAPSKLKKTEQHNYLIKFHDFADNSQEGMKHQMRGATQTQQGMTL
jgi:hypothetical protein